MIFIALILTCDIIELCFEIAFSAKRDRPRKAGQVITDIKNDKNNFFIINIEFGERGGFRFFDDGE